MRVSALSVEEGGAGAANPWRRRASLCVPPFLLGVAVGCIAVYLILTRAHPNPTLPPNCRANCTEVSHELWSGLLRSHLRPATINGIALNGIDYEGMRGDARLPRYLEVLASAPLEQLSEQQRKALFINAYNALAVQMMLSHPCEGASTLCSSITNIPNVWNIEAGVVGGQALSLDNIEKGQLLPLYPADARRIHSAVNCASASCPDVRHEAYEAAGLDAQLDDQARLWLANEFKGLRVDESSGAVFVSKILSWYSSDFADPPAGDFLRAYAPAALLPSLAAVKGTGDLAFMPYDWSLNCVGECP